MIRKNNQINLIKEFNSSRLNFDQYQKLKKHRSQFKSIDKIKRQNIKIFKDYNKKTKKAINVINILGNTRVNLKER